MSIAGAFARPLLWCAVAAIGLVMIATGAGIEAYRQPQDGAASRLIGFSNPGIVLGVIGVALAAVGILAAISIIALRDAASRSATMRRGVALVFAWTIAGVVAVGAVTYLVAADVTIGRGAAGGAAVRAPTGIVLNGSLAVDGKPLLKSPVGVRVIRDGLVTACQQGVAQVDVARYEITVLPESAARGCGAAGAEVVLWAFTANQFLYSTETLPWPAADGVTVVFDAKFSTATPNGATPAVTEIGGNVLHRDGTAVGPGALVEAFVGETRCGTASVGAISAEGYVMLVAGPTLNGCTKDATVTFSVDGRPAAETVLNDMAGGGTFHKLDLTVP